MTSTKPAHPIADLELDFDVEPALDLPPTERRERQARRVGYLVGIVVNAVLLFICNNLLEWEWPPFLTEAFTDALPYINASIVATMVATAIYVGYDRGWFKSLTQVVTAGFALVATIRLYDVFPFDYAAYDFPWEATTRVVLILVMVATVLGMVVESVRFLARLADGPSG